MKTMELEIVATCLECDSFGGIVIGYVLKRVANMIVIVFPLFLAGLAYLQYQGIAILNSHIRKDRWLFVY